MRLPRVRFTVRQLMIVVAVGCLLLGGLIWVKRMRQRSEHFARLAREYKREFQNHQAMPVFYLNVLKLPLTESSGYAVMPLWSTRDGYGHGARLRDPIQDENTLRALSSREKIRSAYFGRLEQKYRLAASRPWLSVVPDPPPPE